MGVMIKYSSMYNCNICHTWIDFSSLRPVLSFPQRPTAGDKDAGSKDSHSWTVKAV